jgi:Phage gp6-like head-tail connector protein
MSFIERLMTDPDEQITLTQIKNWLKVEHDLDNDLLNQLKEGVIHQAFNFMQYDFQEVNEQGELVDVPIPFTVKTACLMFIAYLYENRGDNQTTMPLNCMKLLTPYKRLVGT